MLPREIIPQPNKKVKSDFGYVYFIQQDNDDIFKIGVTSRNPLERLKQLQTASPYSLKLYGYLWIPCPENIESFFHFLCQDKLIKNEWFNLNRYEAEHLLKDCFTSCKGPIIRVGFAFHGKIKMLYCNYDQVFIDTAFIPNNLLKLYLDNTSSSLVIAGNISVDYNDFVKVINELIHEDARQFFNFIDVKSVLSCARTVLPEDNSDYASLVMASSLAGTIYNFTDNKELSVISPESFSPIAHCYIIEKNKECFAALSIDTYEMEVKIKNAKGKGGFFTLCHYFSVPVLPDYQLRWEKRGYTFLDSKMCILRMFGQPNKIHSIFALQQREWAKLGVKLELVEGIY